MEAQDENITGDLNPHVRREQVPSSSSDVPDPPEDDLDDLDDILDDFDTVEHASQHDSRTQASRSAPTERNKEHPAIPLEDFETQMAALMHGLGQPPVNNPSSVNSATRRDRSSEQESSGPFMQSPADGDAFQNSIQRTMERINQSNNQNNSSDPEGDAGELLEQLLQEMQGEATFGEDDDEGFNKMLLGMMEQLTNKDILFDPMKELHEKFPAWIQKNQDKETEANMQRYKLQQTLVKDIVNRFEQKEYSDVATADREFIVDRMQKMQAAGNLPPDLVGGMECQVHRFPG